MPKTIHFERKQQLWLHIMTFWLFWAWFWGLCLNQNHTFPCRMDFIFYELLEENSTASSWNMKSVRQRKVFVWEKTSPFWWNSHDSIYNRVSYRNSPNAVFRHRKFWETTRKIRISKPKSKIRGILNFKQLMEASLHRSNGPRDQLHFGVPSTDFADRGPSTKLEFCNTYCSQSWPGTLFRSTNFEKNPKKLPKVVGFVFFIKLT